MPRTASILCYEDAIEACARGEIYALKRLYESDAARLLAMVIRIVRDRQLAEDVLQEAYLDIWTGATTFNRARGSGRGWIYTIVRHSAFEALRRARNDPIYVTEEIVEFADAMQSLDGDHDPPYARDLERCLQHLDPASRQCIVDACVLGYTHEQIAAKVGAPLGTVKSWIRRGLLALRKCLS